MSGENKHPYEISDSHRHSLPVAGRLALEAATAQEGPALLTRANLYLAIGNAPRDRFGDVIPTVGQRTEIIQALSVFDGLQASAAYATADVAAGVERARQLVKNSQSTTFLSRLQMVTERHYLPDTKNQLRINMEGELAIDPRRIIGVGGLRNWQGMAYDDRGSIVTKQEEGDLSGQSQPNHALIDDYASRDTPLPAAKGVELFLTTDGVFAFSHDSHRVAAAQLRHEPVRIHDMKLYDYRTQPTDPQTQAALHYGLHIAEHNSGIV